MGLARSGHGSGSVRAVTSQRRLVGAAGSQTAQLGCEVREGPTAGIRPSQVAAKRPLALHKVNLPEPRKKKKRAGVCSLGYKLHSTPAQLGLLRVA